MLMAGAVRRGGDVRGAAQADVATHELRDPGEEIPPVGLADVVATARQVVGAGVEGDVPPVATDARCLTVEVPGLTAGRGTQELRQAIVEVTHVALLGRARGRLCSQVRRVRHEDHPATVPAEVGPVGEPRGLRTQRSQADPLRRSRETIPEEDVGRGVGVPRHEVAGRRGEDDLVSVVADAQAGVEHAPGRSTAQVDAHELIRRRRHVVRVDLEEAAGRLAVHEVGGDRDVRDRAAVAADHG